MSLASTLLSGACDTAQKASTAGQMRRTSPLAQVEADSGTSSMSPSGRDKIILSQELDGSVPTVKKNTRNAGQPRPATLNIEPSQDPSFGGRENEEPVLNLQHPHRQSPEVVGEQGQQWDLWALWPSGMQCGSCQQS